MTGAALALWLSVETAERANALADLVGSGDVALLETERHDHHHPHARQSGLALRDRRHADARDGLTIKRESGIRTPPTHKPIRRRKAPPSLRLIPARSLLQADYPLLRDLRRVFGPGPFPPNGRSPEQTNKLSQHLDFQHEYTDE
jgi:hypothetical protein